MNTITILNKVYKLVFFTLVAVMATGCFPKIDKDLPPLSEYISSEGWYEDAFVRVYSRHVETGPDVVQNNFTHPWIVVKRSNSEDIFSLELSKFANVDIECSLFDHWNPIDTYQVCGYIKSTYGNALDDIGKLEENKFSNRPVYRLGELRGGEDVNAVAEFILDQAKYYSCRNEYKPLNRNSNTFVRAMLEYSGFYQLYEEIHGEAFSMGNASIGQSSWVNCPIEDA